MAIAPGEERAKNEKRTPLGLANEARKLGFAAYQTARSNAEFPGRVDEDWQRFRMVMDELAKRLRTQVWAEKYAVKR